MKFRFRKGIRHRFIAHLLFTTGITAVATYLIVQYFLVYREKSQNQLMYWQMAEYAAPELEQVLTPEFKEVEAHNVLQKLQNISRNAEFYLLDQTGQVLLSGFPDSENDKFASRQVALGPIAEFLRQQADTKKPYLLNTNPLIPEVQDPFSAAKLTVGSQPAYLYVILVSKARRATLNRTIRLSVIAATFIAIFIIILGLVGFSNEEYRFLKSSFGEINQVIERLSAGDFSARIDVSKSEELVSLGEKINQVAQTLHDSIEELKRTDQLRRELISNISHDLNTPLSSALGYVRRLNEHEQSTSPEERVRFLKTTQVNLEMLQRLISELFELSKLDAEDVVPQWEAFSLLDIISEEVLPAYAALADQHQVNLRAEHPPKLPYAYGDGEMITRVICNLVENAIRYHRPGGNVVVKVEQAEPKLRVSVIDNGIGIAEDQLEKIFDRFYRVNPARKKGGGSGLGLAIVKKIIEMHHQEIRVESELNIGTTFSFALDTTQNASSIDGSKLGRKRELIS